jgi:type I restriction enzyme, S subunit
MENSGILPETWRLVRCQDVIDVRDGTHDTPQKVEIGIPLITSKNLKPEGIDFSEVTYISEFDHQQIEKRSKVDEGDILFAMIGTIGNPVIVKKDRQFSIKNVALFKLGATQVIPAYFKYLLSTPFLKEQLDSSTRGGTQKFVSLSVLRNLQIPLPPIAQQKRIAAILDQAEALRSHRREAIGLLDELGRSVFLEMFGDPILNEKGFQIKKLIELVDSSRPISYGILMPGADQESGIPYVRVVDMKDGGIDVTKVRKTTSEISHEFRRSVLKFGDLLISIRGHVGRLAIVPSELNGANITQDTARLAVKYADTVFVRECLRIDSFQWWMARHTKGVAVRGINLGDVKEMPIPMPPLPLQQQFAQRIAAIEALKATHREALTQLDALFASLQHRAFRGEL